MIKTFVYKLKPNRTQETKFSEALEICRRLYNHSLSERKNAWEREQRAVGFFEQSAGLPDLKQTDPSLTIAYSQLLQNVLVRLDRAFQGFFRRCQNGENPGYPRFRGEGRYDSFTYPQWGNGAKFREGRLVLSKIGSIRICADRPLEGKPKTCTIIRQADGWHAAISCEVDPKPLPATGEIVGIDLGIESFATLSTGEQVNNPRYYRRAERSLTKSQRQVSRRKKGSNRRRKARVLLAKAHQRVKRARLDFCHKAAVNLIERFDVLYVESLNVQGMLKNHSLAKSISDAGWSLFLNVLCSKAASAGRQVVAVNPTGTSQTCSGCGARVPKKLSERWHSCPYCELSLHRDHNAAIRVLQVGGGTAVGR